MLIFLTERQTLAKWFSFLQLLHLLPRGGQCPSRCLEPQFPHSLSASLDVEPWGVCLLSWRFDSLRLRSSGRPVDWCLTRLTPAWTVSPPNNFICCLDSSAMRHISIAFCNVRSVSDRRRRSRTVFEEIPLTILLHMRSSFSSPHSHDAVRVRSSVTNWSIDSPGCWSLVRKRWRSTTRFLLGLQ